MTAPNQPNPSGSATQGGLSAFAAKTAAQRKTEVTAPVKNSLETNFFGSWISNLFGGFLGGIAGLVSSLFGGIFGGGSGGGLLDLIGGFLGIKDDVREVVEVEVPRLDNRIDELAGGVQRAQFGSTGTWNKPVGCTRIEVVLIGGGPGGARRAGSAGGSAGSQAKGGGPCGYTKYTFLASDVPSSLTVTIGAAGGGGASNSTPGADGTDTSFGPLISAGGGKGDGTSGYGTEICTNYGGDGGTQGTNGVTTNVTQRGGPGPFSSGGAPGTSGGGAGGDGTGPSNSALLGPGSGGGGGGPTGTGTGGRGGNGGYPGGAGGGGGNFGIAGTSGNGGSGSPGAAYVTSYFN